MWRANLAWRLGAPVVATIAAMTAIFTTLANTDLRAQTVTPSDVKIVEAEVAKSLTGAKGEAAKGRLLYFNRKLGNCLACHANKDVSGQPFHGQIGPALDGVGARYSEQQLRAILVDAKQVLGKATIMPAFYKVINNQRTRKEFHNKTIMTAAQIEDVIAYLLTLKD